MDVVVYEDEQLWVTNRGVYAGDQVIPLGEIVSVGVEQLPPERPPRHVLGFIVLAMVLAVLGAVVWVVLDPDRALDAVVTASLASLTAVAVGAARLSHVRPLFAVTLAGPVGVLLIVAHPSLPHVVRVADAIERAVEVHHDEVRDHAAHARWVDARVTTATGGPTKGRGKRETRRRAGAGEVGG